MNKKLFLTLAAFFLALQFSSCNFNTNEKIDLTNGWSYSLSDPLYGNADFSPLPQRSLEDLAALVSQRKGFIWLEKKFDLPKSFIGHDLTCFLGRIAIADKTWVNGAFIGGEGSFPPSEFSAWNVTRKYSIPQNILNEEQNTILIKIWCDANASISSTPYIGLRKTAGFIADWESFWTGRLFFIFAFCAVIVSIYHFIIFARRRSEKENLTFALVNIFSAIFFISFSVYEIPGFPPHWLSFLWFYKICFAALPFVISFFATSFIYNYINVKENKIIFIIRLLITLAPVVFALISKSYFILHERMAITTLCLLPLFVYMLFVLIFCFPKHKKHTAQLFLGFFPFIAAVVADFVIHSFLHNVQIIKFSETGWMASLLVLLFLMARRCAKARSDAEDLNANLKNEVKHRTNEASKSEQQLEDAAKKTQQEIHLVSQVQNTFLKTELSSLEGWDAAVYSKPLEQVSGDLYDFFTEEKTLKGLALFDVSGHGISAGLVTLLAKNIINKKFREGAMQNLGKVMSSISTSIAKEKGSVENYLTGILVRTDGNRIEFVNAGHPKAFFRKASGQIAPVESAASSQNQDIKVALSVLPPDCKTIGFTLQTKDSIILYTQSLVHAKNSFGEEFGYERISKAFAGSGNGSAQEKLNVILDIFNLYVTDVPVEDDLTIIVLQKK